MSHRIASVPKRNLRQNCRTCWRKARERTPISGIAEESGEEEELHEVLRPSSRINRRRCCWQSSMDSIPGVEPIKRIISKTTKLSIRKWEVECRRVRARRRTDLGPCRLSQRLQHNDRAILNTPFHPYARPSPSPGKSLRSQLSSLNPSTPSSSTLNLSLFSN